ncbi:uncharacterized protein N7500_008454 [Penicillium coprophilum]|uniref:uncharacterized protein n=1 Tax=Penicillium coprophilum TaxID=36646 RepID=UPI002399BDBA|nr:uncharacterized protein N7500_008454 [Penicillium coprophilum]KAJ5158803.1 hypothetical protein N7500_008454 [Penicillium coprophilum]
MVVRPIYPTSVCEGDMALKLFDGHFATEFREKDEMSPRGSDIEHDYHQFILNGDAAKLVAELSADRDLPDRDFDTWNSSQKETYLHSYMHGLYERETQAYNTLADLQGNYIPRLFSCVTMSSFSPTQNSVFSEDINIPGMALRYVEGFPLTDIASCVSKDSWQRIYDNTIRVVNLVSNRGIPNENVKASNFIVETCPGNQFHVFKIDFALCKCREEYRDETEWEACKATQDEEGAVGYVMQRRLQGGFVYRRSARYNNLDEKYKMEG